MVGVEVLRGSLSGYGNGDGDGYGNGYGDGYGDGCGYGYGDGYGDGDGDGYGYGYGDGNGCGYGDGYGNGYGDGDGEYWAGVLALSTNGWTAAQRQRVVTLQAQGVRLAFWRSNSDGSPSNGGKRIAPAAVGVTHKTKGPLSLCEAGTLHATLIPPKWRGEKVWIVALHGEVIGDDEKFGCLEREILGELLQPRVTPEPQEVQS